MGLIYDRDTCNGCMLCPKVCNFGAIEKDGDKVKFDLDKCVFCGLCAILCPVYAIEFKFNEESIRDLSGQWMARDGSGASEDFLRNPGPPLAGHPVPLPVEFAGARQG